jgi:hypothetical protein
VTEPLDEAPGKLPLQGDFALAAVPARGQSEGVVEAAGEEIEGVACMGAVPLTARQMLDCYDRISVEAMARGRGLTVARGASKEDLLQQLQPVLFAGENAAAAVASLSPEELAVLQFVKESGGQTTAPAVLQQMWARGVPKADDSIRSLLKRGLLLYPYEPERAAGAGRYGKLAGHWRFWAPGQVLDAVALPPVELPAEVFTEAPPPDNVLPASVEFLADLYRCWHYLSEAAVSPLRGGGIGRRHRARLAGSLAYSDRLWRAREDEVAGSVDFLFHLLQGVGAAAVEGDQLVPTPAGDALFGQPNPELLRQLLRAWTDSTAWSEFRRIPELALVPGDLRGNSDLPTTDTLCRARRFLLQELSRAPVGQWLSLPRFLDFLKRRNLEFLIPRLRPESTHYRGLLERRDGGEHRLSMPADWERVEGRFVHQVFTESLHRLGLVELGLTRSASDPEATCVSFRLTEAGAAALAGRPNPEEAPPEMRLIVQPTFELIALNACENLAALRELCRFADLDKIDKACSLHLSAESVRRGIQSGFSAGELLATLETHSDTPLPQNVTYSLRDWAQSFERIKLQPAATLLEVERSDTLDSLVESPRWGRLIQRRIAPTLAVVDAGRAADLLALLQRRGLRCRELVYGMPPRGELSLNGLELRVPKAAHTPYVEYFLAKIAESAGESAGQVVYRLSAESVRQGLAQGLSLREVADFLRDGVRDKVPTELLVTLKAWAGRYRPVRLETKVLFSAPDAKTLDELLKVPEIGALIEGRVGMTDALVPPDRVAELRRRLCDMQIEVEHRDHP